MAAQENGARGRVETYPTQCGYTHTALLQVSVTGYSCHVLGYMYTTFYGRTVLMIITSYSGQGVVLRRHNISGDHFCSEFETMELQGE